MIIMLGEHDLKVLLEEVFKKKIFQQACLKIIINPYISNKFLYLKILNC